MVFPSAVQITGGWNYQLISQSTDLKTFRFKKLAWQTGFGFNANSNVGFIQYTSVTIDGVC